MKNFIQYETQFEYDNPKLKKKKSVPKWVWIGSSFFTFLLIIFAISIEQTDNIQHYVSEPRLLILSFFSYNLLVGAIFAAFIGALLAVLIYIFSKIFLTASLFLTFILITLLSPFIIPFFIKTSMDVAPLLSFNSNLVEQAKYYEEKIQAEKKMKLYMDEKAAKRLAEEELNRLKKDATEFKIISSKPDLKSITK